MADKQSALAAFNGVVAEITAIAVAPPPQPGIVSFTAAPAVLTVGGSVILSAEFANAERIELDHVAVPFEADGKSMRQVVTPTVSRGYTVTAYGAAGTTPVSMTVSVTVNSGTPVVLPPVITKMLDQSKMMVVAGWMTGADRYDRFQRLTVLVPDANGRAKVPVFVMDLQAGGLMMYFDGVRVVNANGTWVRPKGADGLPLPAQTAPLPLTLHLDTPYGARTTVATLNADPLLHRDNFDADLSGVAEGWYTAMVTGAGGWSVVDYPVYVLKGATAKPHALCPSVTASSEFHSNQPGLYPYQIAWVPTEHAPNTVPMPVRQCPVITGPLTREKWVATEIAPNRLSDIHRPVQSAEGIWSCFHAQHYLFTQFEAALPATPVMDGRRGIGTLAGVMHFEWSTATIPTPPFNGPVDSCYFTDTWRFGKIMLGDYRGADRGRIVTLVGYRHKNPPPYRTRFDDPYQKTLPTNLELVGNWDAIPPARWGFRRLWGIAWDSRSTAIDLAAAPIPSEDNLRPHAAWANHTGASQAAGVRVFLPDMGGSRICLVQFNAASHSIAPTVTEFVTNLPDVFDVVECGRGSGVMAASVRGQSRVVFISQDSGAILAEFATQSPEGLGWLDGELYYSWRSPAAGVMAAASIKKRGVSITGDVVTLAPERVAVILTRPWVINDNSGFVKFALDDGRFYLRGMIAEVSWSNANNGLPHLFLPGENVSTPVTWLTPSTPWVPLKGPPEMPEGARGYQSGVGFGPGRMLCSTVQESVIQISQALPSDPPYVDVTVGYNKYKARGHHLTRGNHGWTYGQPVPWDEDPDIDRLLLTYGHVKP